MVMTLLVVSTATLNAPLLSATVTLHALPAAPSAPFPALAVMVRLPPSSATAAWVNGMVSPVAETSDGGAVSVTAVVENVVAGALPARSVHDVASVKEAPCAG